MFVSLSIVLLSTFFAAAVATTARTAVLTRDATVTPHYDVLSVAAPSDLVRFTIGLRAADPDALDRAFRAVSYPDSPQWGKFLTYEALQQVVTAPQAAHDALRTWFAACSAADVKVVDHRTDAFRATVTVACAKVLFGAEAEFVRCAHNLDTKRRVSVILHGTATLPAELAAHVSIVTRMTELHPKKELELAYRQFRVARALLGPKKLALDDARVAHMAQKLLAKSSEDNNVTPSILIKYYGFSNITATSGTKSTSGIAAFDDYYSVGAVKQFWKQFDIPAQQVTNVGSADCIESSNCDQYESDLDVQYMTSMAQNVPITFMANDAQSWIYDWAKSTQSMSGRPMIASISYGWAEAGQCDIADCSDRGYTTQQYVEATNDELQKLGTLGMTVLVASGDDGAPSLGGASGNCPIDDSKYCLRQTCRYSSTECGGIIITGPPASGQARLPAGVKPLARRGGDVTCILPMGLGSNGCGALLGQGQELDDPVDNALQAFGDKNSRCGWTPDQDDRKQLFFHSTCSCSSLQSTETSGYTVAPYVYSASNGAIFAPDFPCSSPYVTAVGATQFVWSGATPTNSILASIETGAKITAGGGFSAFQQMPDYQSDIVNDYLQNEGANLPPSGSFAPTMRAYPDISAVGHNYQIVASNGTDSCDGNCQTISVDGTSCSTPTVAGFLATINHHLLSAGHSQIGFFNPTLYQMAKASPDTLKPMLAGNSNCNRAWCCLYGFKVSPPATGTVPWNPASGLGALQGQEVLSYLLALKEQHAARYGRS